MYNTYFQYFFPLQTRAHLRKNPNKCTTDSNLTLFSSIILQDHLRQSKFPHLFCFSIIGSSNAQSGRLNLFLKSRSTKAKGVMPKGKLIAIIIFLLTFTQALQHVKRNKFNFQLKNVSLCKMWVILFSTLFVLFD